MKRLYVLFVLLIGAAAARAEAPALLVFGDSISAGYGLAHADQGWVGLLRSKLKDLGYGDTVINASVSGETTAGGVARLPRALAQHHPAVVILELGGNDGLRALPLNQMRDNLGAMIDLSRAGGARVLLLGMRIPPNYGPEYAERFRAIFAEVAKAKQVPLVPFLLSDVALDASLMQADGIHPNESGQPKLLSAVWKELEPLLRK